ncbi:MAG: NAD-dependent deacylase [Chlorobi bacterium]|nr:NAD-dependent deacylase [Chlorobiota bacterium]
MRNKPHIVVLTGAGISKESGIPTFRDMDGLWQQYRIEEVASPEAWRKNPQLVLDFYNMRRRKLAEVEPNAAHKALARLEQYLPVTVITQNVDDLHERAGSKRVLHLHGELKKVRSEKNPRLVYPWEGDLHLGDLAEDGAQLRPHIVWFGEPVPAIEEAARITRDADIFLIVGTSMQVYPAAGLIHELHPHVPIYYVDPSPAPLAVPNPLHVIPAKATEGVPPLADKWIREYA